MSLKEDIEGGGGGREGEKNKKTPGFLWGFGGRAFHQSSTCLFC